MHLHAGELVVIEPGAPHAGIVEREAERFDQMQLGAGIGAQANDVAGVGRDFRLDQDDMKQADSP